MQAHQIDEVKGELAPGTIYVALSSTAAYGQLLAMVDRKEAIFLGERYVDSVTKALTVEVPGVPVDRKPNPSIGIGREFFVTALKDYENWREKWWREAIQNAVDAGATDVACVAKANPDGTRTVSCEDNGGGMSADVLLNKFLVLGGSTKTSASGTAGGFGKAKELLLLPWISWEVHSRATIVRGSGIDYTVEEAAPISGTKITVVMAQDQYTYEAPAISFIEKCYLPRVSFTVNGDPVKAALRSKKVLLTTANGEAEISFVKDPSVTGSSRIFFRTNGLFMFDKWVYAGNLGGYVMVELLKPSIDILTANRDGIRAGDLRREIDEFAANLAREGERAMKDKKKLIREVFRGTGKFVQSEARKERAADMLDVIGPISISGKDPLTDVAIKRVLSIVEDYRSSDTSIATSDVERIAIPTAQAAGVMLEFVNGPESVEVAIDQLVWRPDFYLHNDVEGVRIPKEFYPATMSPRIAKMAAVWAELCRFVFIQLGKRARYGVGFIFSKDTLAEYVVEQGTEWLLINPYRDVKNQKNLLRVTDDEDLSQMYASAIHECTHMADGRLDHDSAFAAALTHNMGRCARGWRKVRQIEKSILMRDVAKSDDEGGGRERRAGSDVKKSKKDTTSGNPTLDRLVDQLVIAVADSSRLSNLSETDAVKAIMIGVDDDVSSLHYPTWEAAGELRDYLKSSEDFRRAVTSAVTRAHAMNRRWRGDLGQALLHRGHHVRRHHRLLFEQAHRRPRRSGDNGGASTVLHGLLPGRRRGALLAEDVSEDARVHDEQLLVRLGDPDVRADDVGRLPDRVDPYDTKLRLLVEWLHEETPKRIVVGHVDLGAIGPLCVAAPAHVSVSEAVVVDDRVSVPIGGWRFRTRCRERTVRRRWVSWLPGQIARRPRGIVAVGRRRDEAHVGGALRRHDPERLRLVVVLVAVDVVPVKLDVVRVHRVAVEGRVVVHPERVVDERQLGGRHLRRAIRSCHRAEEAVLAVGHTQRRDPAGGERHAGVLHATDHVVHVHRLAGGGEEHVVEHARRRRRDHGDATHRGEALQIAGQVLQVELGHQVDGLVWARDENRRRLAAREDVANGAHELVADLVDGGAKLPSHESTDGRSSASSVGRTDGGCGD